MLLDTMNKKNENIIVMRQSFSSSDLMRFSQRATSKMTPSKRHKRGKSSSQMRQSSGNSSCLLLSVGGADESSISESELGDKASLFSILVDL